MSGAPDAGAPEAQPTIRFVHGAPDDAEVAAVTAVLTVALEQLAQASRRSGAPARSAWDASRHAPRRTPVPGGWSWPQLR